MRRGLVRAYRHDIDNANIGDTIPVVTVDMDCPRCGGTGVHVSESMGGKINLLVHSKAYRERLPGHTGLPDHGVALCGCVDVEMKVVL